MGMIVYHKLRLDKLGNVLTNGLPLDSGDDERAALDTTDAFLNDFRPKRLEQVGVDRKSNIYCYMTRGDAVIDIKSGEKVKTISQTIHDPDQAFVRVEVDPKACYVSDLDIYDEIKACLGKRDMAQAHRLAQIYWQKLQILARYDDTMQRPEIMVTYSILPTAIRKAGE